jgi:succinate-acetate transporter protein
MSTTTTDSPPAAVADPGIADPAPLGLAAFAMTTFVLSVSNANVWPAAVSGALAFSSYGAFWIAFWYLVTHILPTVKPADDPVVVGVFLLGWLIFTAYMTIASMRVSGAVLVVFILLTITFLLLTIGNFQSKTSIVHAGGWFGIATAAAAWYASFAGVTNSTFKKVVLPVFPLAP